MEANQSQVKAVVLLEVEQVFMHRLLDGEKTLFTSGTCKIAKLDNARSGPVYFINLNSFYYGIHPDIYFLRLTYPDTVAYVFPHFDQGLSAISLLANSPHLAALDEILSNAARLVDYPTAIQREEIKVVIDKHCPKLESEQIYYPDVIKKGITLSGKALNSAFTALGGLLSAGVSKVGNYLNEKITEGEPTHVKAETKEKWEKLKQGTNNFVQVSTDFASKLLAPVVEKTKEYAHEIQEKVDKSENSTVKYAKELAQVSGKAIGEAFDGLVKGGTEVTRELGEQSKKIITKKYGDQVIQAFSGEQKEEVPPISIGAVREDHGEKVERKEEKKEELKEEQGSDVRLLGQSSENLYPQI